MAGERPNIVCPEAFLEIDVRGGTAASFVAVRAAVEDLAARPRVPGASVTVAWREVTGPMEGDAGTAWLLGHARAAAAELGFVLGDAATGGASDANTTAALGVPTLDGLGPVGGDDHAPTEWLDLGSVESRVQLLASLVVRVGAA